MLRWLTALTLLLAGVCPAIHALAAAPAATELFVAPNGSDANPGTKDQPLATIAKAQELVRQKIAAGLSADVTVQLRSGTYRLEQPLVFGPEDSGTPQNAVTFAGFPGETVVISGGQSITGWKKGTGEIWTANVDVASGSMRAFRHLFVNGRRAVRARTPNQDAENPSWQLAAAELAADLSRYTLQLPPDLLGAWSNQTDIEVMVSGNWEINRLPVQSIDRATRVVVLAPPHVQGHESIRPGPDRWCHFENAPEMLDQPGEWYLDRSRGVLSYWPLGGEDMSAAEVIAPQLERLVQVQGAAEQPVRNLHFRGLRFEHVGWTLPPGGYMGIQACHFTAGKGWTGDWGARARSDSLGLRPAVQPGRLRAGAPGRLRSRARKRLRRRSCPGQ